MEEVGWGVTELRRPETGSRAGLASFPSAGREKARLSSRQACQGGRACRGPGNPTIGPSPGSVTLALGLLGMGLVGGLGLGRTDPAWHRRESRLAEGGSESLERRL